uniref:Uncharacterized protein n=1 Tax=Pogona vitticeps TaxID=103695 RepID=A0ABM5FPU6_9SAUR
MMALADFHYTTGISSGFKVYILEGHPSFENEQRFQRLPSHRFPVYSIKRKLSVDARRSPDPILERQKVSKMMRRSTCGPVASSQEQVALPTSQLPGLPPAVSCVTTPRTEPCRDSSPVLHPSCPHRCPLRKPLVDPASLTMSQLQQMRPSVITCAPRRSCPETRPSLSPPISPINQKSNTTPDSPRSQRLPPWTTSPAGPSVRFSRESSQKEKIQEADETLSPIP